MTNGGTFAFALLLTTLAGLSTIIGSFIAISVRRPGPAFLATAMGFTAGVMLLVSFVELLATGIKDAGFLPAMIAFFLGFVAIYLIDAAVPHHYISEKAGDRGLGDSTTLDVSKLKRTGMLVAMGIAIHNFPEGMATMGAALADPSLGIAIAVAIAIHNIPEGIAVAVPIHAATGSKKQAFWWSALSGVSEPVGAGIAGLILLPFLTGPIIAITLAAVAGLMVFIALDELLPASQEHGHHHLSIIGMLTGMVVMATSLYLLQ